MKKLPVVNKPTKSHKTMRLDDNLIMEVQELALSERRSFGNMIEVLLCDALLSKAIKA